jgi:hypothetical protein
MYIVVRVCKYQGYLQRIYCCKALHFYIIAYSKKVLDYEQLIVH